MLLNGDIAEEKGVREGPAAARLDTQSDLAKLAE